MKTYQGGIVIGHKKRFAVVRVEKAVIDNREDAIKTMQSLLPMFPGLPVVLVAEEAKDRPLYFARPDIMNFLMDFHLPSVEWKAYTLAE